MSGVLINLIIQIISGAVGGNGAGAASKDVSLGTIGNTIAGAIGGDVGGQLLAAFIPLLAQTTSTVDIGALMAKSQAEALPAQSLRQSWGSSRTR